MIDQAKKDGIQILKYLLANINYGGRLLKQ